MSEPNNGDRVLVVIDESIQRRGYPPTISEVSEQLGLSRTAVAYWIRKLADQGVITFVPGQARTIRLVKGMS